MLKLKNRCIVVLKDEEEKSSNYRVPKELFLKFQEELAQYRLSLCYDVMARGAIKVKF